MNVLQYEIFPSLMMFIICFFIFSFNVGTIFMLFIAIGGYISIELGFLKEKNSVKLLGRILIGFSTIILLIISASTIFWGLELN